MMLFFTTLSPNATTSKAQAKHQICHVARYSRRFNIFHKEFLKDPVKNLFPTSDEDNL